MLGIETSCDETGVGIVRGTTLLADEVASSVEAHARFGGVVPEVASRAHLEAMLPTMARALDAAGVRLSDVDAIAVTAGPGPGRRAAGRRRGGQGVRARGRQADLRREPPRRARGGRHPRARRAARAGHRAAGVGWALVAAAGRRSGRRRHPARAPRSTTPPARRTTRWPGCSACRSRAGRRSTGRPARATPRAIAFPRGLTAPAGPGRAPVRLLVLGTEDRRGPLGRGPAAGRRAGTGRRCRGELPGGGLRRAHRQGGRCLPRARASTRW